MKYLILLILLTGCNPFDQTIKRLKNPPTATCKTVDECVDRCTEMFPFEECFEKALEFGVDDTACKMFRDLHEICLEKEIPTDE
jgi:hypothetical protein